jgi:hypothetical protein
MRILVSNDRPIAPVSLDAVSINVLPRLEGRKSWTPQGLKFQATAHNLDLFKELGFEIIDQREPEEEFVVSYKVPYTPRHKPDKHQMIGLEKGIQKDHFAYFMDVGTGKSYMFIYLMGKRYVNKLITGAVIVSPKGVNYQWVNEQIPEHIAKGLKWRAIVFRKNKPVIRDILEPYSGLEIMVIHIDAMDTKVGFKTINDFIEKHKGKIMFGIDEADLIKNYRAGRTVAAMEFRDKVRFRCEMTGTPVPAKLQDLWSEFRWLDPNILGIEYVSTFRREYCIMGGFMNRDVIGYRDTERFHNKIAPYIYSVSRTEIGVLPPEYHRWRFELGPKQRRLYDDIKEEMDKDMEDQGGYSYGKIGNRLMTLQQICSGFMTDADGKIMELGENPRAEQLIELLEAKKPQKALIWARFHYDLDVIKRIVGDAGVEYSGRIDDDTRERNKQAWLSEGGPTYFYGTPGSGGVGLNLQGRCRHGFYYTNSYKARERWQSEGRISRRGQWGPAEFTDLIARNTKDTGILANLRRKKNIQDLALKEMRRVVDGHYEDYDFE